MLRSLRNALFMEQSRSTLYSISRNCQPQKCLMSFGKFGNKEDDKDRSEVISPEMSKNYVNSEAYKKTYGTEPVWVMYRRNHKGQFPPTRTRSSCIKENKISTGNPCPICRDKYLIVHHRNPDLLKQFVSPYTDTVLPVKKTQVCEEQQMKVEVEVEIARRHGFLPFYVPHRDYNYNEYYKTENEDK